MPLEIVLLLFVLIIFCSYLHSQHALRLFEKLFLQRVLVSVAVGGFAPSHPMRHRLNRMKAVRSKKKVLRFQTCELKKEKSELRTTHSYANHGTDNSPCDEGKNGNRFTLKFHRM